MECQPTTRWSRPWVAIAAITAMAVSATASRVGATPEPPSPVTGDARVIAQGLVDLDDAAQQWSFVLRDVDAFGVDVDHSAPTFVIVAGGAPMLLEGSDGVRARLAPDEAVFRPAGATAERALGVGQTSTAEISIGPAGEAGVGEPFTPGAGAHDLDLVHDLLEPGESVQIRSLLPALVYVASGSVTDGDTGTEIATGTSAVLAGDLTLTGGDDGLATVFVAVIGRTLDLSLPTSTIAQVTTVPAGTRPSSPTTPAPTDLQPTDPPPATDAPTTDAPTTSPPPTDPPTTTTPPTDPPTTTTAPVDAPTTTTALVDA